MKHIVQKAESGLRLMDLIQSLLGADWSRRRIKKLIDLKACSLNGEKVEVSTRKVHSGDEIFIDEKKFQRTEKKRTQINILFEDDYFLAIDKPIDVISSIGAIGRFFPEHHQLALVHRLDQETSGVMLLAKSESALNAGEDLFRKREVTKVYRAIVVGQIPEQEGRIVSESYGRKNTKNGRDYWTGNAKRGKKAITSWKLKFYKKGMSHLTVFPETGRTHQIRVHMSEKGYPIVGDPLYGDHVTHAERMMLHASSLTFIHPFSGEKVYIKSNVPWDKNSDR